MKYKTFTISLVTILILLIVFVFFPFGYKKYKTRYINIEVPRLSINTKKDKNELRFKTLRDSNIVQYEINKIIKKYVIYKDNGKVYYYDSKQNIYITEYKLKKGFFSNEIIIKFER